MRTTSTPLEAFLVFAGPDRRVAEQLEMHLEPLQRSGAVTLWHPGQLKSGATLEQEIEAHLETAHLFLLLVRASFNTTWGRHHLLRIMARHEAREARVIPILVRPCDLEGLPLAELVPLPRNGRPVKSWANQDAALVDVATGVREALEAFQKDASSRAAQSGSAVTQDPADTRGTTASPPPRDTTASSPPRALTASPPPRATAASTPLHATATSAPPLGTAVLSPSSHLGTAGSAVPGVTRPRVFISHRTADEKEAEALAHRLQARGIDVRLAIWELVVGDSVVAWMEEALAGASFVALCYSSHGVDAPWISLEWQATLSRQLSGQRIRILPVYLTGRQGPALLADVLGADWMADPDRAVDALCRAIFRGRP